MFHLYCINNERPVPLMLVKYEMANIALSQAVPVAYKVVFSRSFWPLNGHLLFIKCVCVCAIVRMSPKGSACALYVFSAPSGGQHHPGLGTSTHSSIPRLV